MNNIRHRKGLTLVELVVALVVTSIVMTAVATLAFAVSSANKASDDTSEKQAQIRFATLRISELLRHSKLICNVSDEDLLVWRADDTSGGENEINAGELVYIETGNNMIRLLEFTDVTGWLRTYSFSLAQLSWVKVWLVAQCTETYTVLIPDCTNVQFGFAPELPPRSEFVTISFDIEENGAEHTYQINAALLGWSENLLDEDDEIVDRDDD